MNISPPTILRRETIADLAREPGNAELIGGRIVNLMATGFRPNLVAVRILRCLADHGDALGRGFTLTDNISDVVNELPSGRESFSPDVSYDDGPTSPNEMRFIQGAPAFAVEVWSEGDYGSAAGARWPTPNRLSRNGESRSIASSPDRIG